MQILIIAGDVFEKLSERDDHGWCRGRTDGPVSTQRTTLMSLQPTETMHDSTSLSDQDFGATWSRTTSDFSINYQKTYLDRCYDYDDYDSQLLKLLSALSVFFSRIWSL